MCFYPTTPTAPRKRTRSPVEDNDASPRPRKLFRVRLTVKAPHNLLERFLTRHLHLLAAGCELVSANDYNTTRRVATDADHERCLFKRYNPVVGRDELWWARAQVACCKKMDVRTVHREGCTGKPDETIYDPLEARMRRCDCPVTVTRPRHIWRVDPCGWPVKVRYTTRNDDVYEGLVVHGQEVEAHRLPPLEVRPEDLVVGVKNQ